MDTDKTTEIFIPERYYQSGYEITVDGTNNWSENYIDDRQTLELFVGEAGVEIEVNIVPD
jgi:hypothetical protein